MEKSLLSRFSYLVRSIVWRWRYVFSYKIWNFFFGQARRTTLVDFDTENNAIKINMDYVVGTKREMKRFIKNYRAGEIGFRGRFTSKGEVKPDLYVYDLVGLTMFGIVEKPGTFPTEYEICKRYMADFHPGEIYTDDTWYKHTFNYHAPHFEPGFFGPKKLVDLASFTKEKEDGE